MNNKTALETYLETLSQNTSIVGEVHKTVLGLLGECWESLGGSCDQNTTFDKVYRAENLSWKPPILSFVLERHGGTVNGSSRAELHHWEVNVAAGVAEIAKTGHRQLCPMDKRMNTDAIAQETAKLIQSRAQHESLKWVEPGVYVVVQIGKVIPETVKQTTAARRARYSERLDSIMHDLGWVRADKGNRMGFRISV